VPTSGARCRCEGKGGSPVGYDLCAREGLLRWVLTRERMHGRDQRRSRIRDRCGFCRSPHTCTQSRARPRRRALRHDRVRRRPRRDFDDRGRRLTPPTDRRSRGESRVVAEWPLHRLQRWRSLRRARRRDAPPALDGCTVNRRGYSVRASALAPMGRLGACLVARRPPGSSSIATSLVTGLTSSSSMSRRDGSPV
jgi:hypothetical protein